MRGFFTSVQLVLVAFCAITNAQVRFADHFASCRKNDPLFDNCLKEGLNSVRPYFKTGLPQYRVAPFDPFHADEVVLMRSGNNFNFQLVLRNVTEAGWTVSQITSLKTDFPNNNMKFTQFFPDKRLNGLYEFEGNFLGLPLRNSGSWNLALFDYTQSMVLSRKPRMSSRGEVYDTPIKADVNVQFCRHLELHISNLFGGRPLIENLADRIINGAWPPGFFVLRPLIGEMVGTAFSKIFTDNFQNFPFNEIIR